MKNLSSLIVLGATLLLSSCAGGNHEIASAKLSATADNKEMGMATFYAEDDNKIRMELEINYPARADSIVAVHFHEHGDCGNMGENAHGHWNPTKEPHGRWDSGAHHSGDIGNIQLDSKGKGHISVVTDRWTVTENDVNSIIGRGIIVHGGTDDYTTQPTGNSGPRVGCGVIEKK
ncbi:superoxide dismutase family protein [Pedobacter deserti]|uniref:superoxide dismutase family protein n=1 Tax=Pedobacter deserti TaxID=2817382 RepID=UPI00210D35AE|nr:superoxide dismutase family protein [Pedobacter sp. SYSU D00382]